MSHVAMAREEWSRSLLAWALRDAVLLVAMFGVWSALASWQPSSASWPAAALVAAASFGFAYVACYIAHEWGHDLGARAMGASPSRGPATGFVMPLFDPRAHSRAQFYGLAYGGQLGYVAMAALLVAALEPDLAHRAAALGAVAFVVQSLYVDQGVLHRVWRGDDIAASIREGAAAAVILRKTGLAWSLLALALAALHALGGLP